MEFLLALLVLLLFAKILGEALHKYGFSPLVGEVAVGIVLGPALLGWIRLDDPDLGPPLWAVAMLGLVVLMLVAGMNSRFDLFMKIKFKALAIALCGMAVSFALGFAVPYAWGYPPLVCLFVGAALSNTATEVVARVVEKRKHSQLIIGAAVIDDILAVYIIGILATAALKRVLDLSVILWATIGIVAFFLAVGYLSRKLIIEMDIMRKLWKFERRGVPLTFAVCLALALAVIASYVGLHMVIGAYMAGLFISRLRERPDALLMSRVRLNEMLEDITISLQAILTPLFFVYVGLSFAPQWGKLNLVMLLALIAAAFAGKIIGCGIGAAAVGYRGRSRLEIGTAMCSRGSLELAVLLFGFKAVEGFTMELFAMMVTVTLVTIIVTPILYKQAARVG